MKVAVNTQYSWSCSRCGYEQNILWMPEIDKRLPACECCKWKGDVCGGIYAEVSRPKPQRKLRTLKE